jgi:NhaA family Na+:H+ antiporter
VFGNGHPAIHFLLLLAVADDAIGLGIIAVVYPDADRPVQPTWLLLTLGGMALAYGLRRLNVGFWPAYILIGGSLSWVGLFKSSIEPALALVAIVPFIPGPRLDSLPFIRESDQDPAVQVASAPNNPTSDHSSHSSPLDHFEHQLKLFVDLGLFFFAFANAGVAFSSINSVTIIVLLSLIVGKTLGICFFGWVATNMGFPLPTGMRIKHVAVTGLIAGLGLTVALFVAGKAFATDSDFHDPAKMGAVLSGSVAVLAFALGWAFKVKDGGGGSSESDIAKQ